MRHAWFAAALLAPLPLWPAPAPAQPPPVESRLDRDAERREGRADARGAERMSERRAVGLARRRFAGNILRITLIGAGRDQRYRIRMEDKGRVFTVFVYVADGRVTGGN